MSLFGDDDVPSRAKQSSSLFDDDAKPAGKTGNSLFADELDSNDSPWAFPTPKKAGRGALVKSLLPASDVPDSYIDAFDALLDAGDRAGNGVSIDGAKRLLASSAIPSDTQTKILDIVSQPDQEIVGLGRNEFNVLFALIGLAQEGDDVTLDSVDERKRSECFSQIIIVLAGANVNVASRASCTFCIFAQVHQATTACTINTPSCANNTTANSSSPASGTNAHAQQVPCTSAQTILWRSRGRSLGQS